MATLDPQEWGKDLKWREDECKINSRTYLQSLFLFSISSLLLPEPGCRPAGPAGWARASNRETLSAR